MSEAIVVKGLTVQYGKAVAVRDASFSAAPGSTTVIVGPNGAGKSSLLNGMMGVIPATAQSILLRGRPVLGLNPTARVKAGLVMVPQGRQLFRHMTVRDNLAVVANAFGLQRSKIEEALLRFPILKQRERALAGVLSGGEQQMLALTRALMCEPSALVLDEPTLGLAPTIVKQFMDGLRSMQHEGKCVVIAEPTLRLLPRDLDQGFIMLGGKIVGTAGSYAELERKYERLLSARSA
jgi:branched-chain amino acid transport system ATP-binding protein